MAVQIHLEVAALRTTNHDTSDVLCCSAVALFLLRFMTSVDRQRSADPRQRGHLLFCQPTLSARFDYRDKHTFNATHTRNSHYAQ